MSEILPKSLNESHSLDNDLQLGWEIKKKVSDLLDLWNNFSSQMLSWDDILDISESDNIWDTQHGNHDVFDRIHYLDMSEVKREENLVIFDWKKIVAVLWLQDSPYEDSVIWLKHLSVDPDYKNKWISKILLKIMFDYIMEEKILTLELSSYSEDWKKYLEKNLNNMWENYSKLTIRNTYWEVIKELNK